MGEAAARAPVKGTQAELASPAVKQGTSRGTAPTRVATRGSPAGRARKERKVKTRT